MAAYEEDHNLQDTPPTNTTRTSDNLLSLSSLSLSMAISTRSELLSLLLSNADLFLTDTPSTPSVKLSDDYTDTLPRIPKSKLSQQDSCPICNMRFLDDPYPLVVQLPCHKTHLFDLECIQSWFRNGNNTCPLDRVDLAKKKVEDEERKRKNLEQQKEAEEQEEEEWDAQYS